MDGINTAMNSQDLIKTRFEVDDFNKTLNKGRVFKTELDKDDFLKILLTQLQHQDPTAPMQDREFIAQMAQFSSLEQMSNMSRGFQKLSGLFASSEAAQYLGKHVELREGDTIVRGRVERVVRGDSPFVMVNGKPYNLDQIEAIVE